MEEDKKVIIKKQICVACLNKKSGNRTALDVVLTPHTCNKKNR